MKILIASGGSGGHIFPAVSLAGKLKNENIIFVASRRRLDKNILANTGYKKYFLSSNPRPRRFGLRTVLFLVKIAMDSLQGIWILLLERPDIVVGFGGYTSGVTVLLASKIKIKTLIHEQNLVPGRTNKLLCRHVDLVAVSFDKTKEYFENSNVVFTGNPLRDDSVEECRAHAISVFSLDQEKFTLLVMGGSQGAHTLNMLISRALHFLPKEEKDRLQVIHITGAKDYEEMRIFYKYVGMNAKVFSFIDKINEAYSVCDAGISRSGAAAIFELAAFAKPMMLVPYPDRRNSQYANAEFFQQKKAAILIDEKNTNEADVAAVISRIIKSAPERKSLSENAKNLSIRDAAERLKEEVLRLVSQV